VSSEARLRYLRKGRGPSEGQDMKIKIRVMSLFLFLIYSLAFSGQKPKNRDLAQKYADFLNLTEYIILPQEKEVLMKLTSDRDRDIFIESFWRQRDPTVGTIQNEFKDEHLRRFNYANKYYGRDVAREGWMTGMGRIYIVLGKPASIERFETTQGLYPTQVWYYYGDQKRNLPAHFGIVFFQRDGSGEYKIYDPVTDGPGRLMIQSKYTDATNYQGLYEALRDLAPTLADVSLSLIPGEIPFDYQPSLMNPIILANIFDSPKKEVNASYATHFLNYKGLVSTEYMTNFVQSDALATIIHDPATDLNFLHFSIVPEHFSLDYYGQKDQYYCNFTLSVSLRKNEDPIFQYSKNIPLYFSPDEAQKISATGIAFEDSIPVIEGGYNITILLQNSVGKEFSLFEKAVIIPGKSDKPVLVGPILGYKLETYDMDLRIPFKILDKKLVVDPKNTFGLNDGLDFFFIVEHVPSDLWNEGSVEITINSAEKKASSIKSFKLRLKDYPRRESIHVVRSFVARDFVPDYYEMNLTLKDARGNILDEKKVNFIISPAATVSHPTAQANAVPAGDKYRSLYILAQQYEKVKDYEKAESCFRRAYELGPSDKRGLISYSNFLFATGKFKKCLELIESIKEDGSLRYDYYLLKGKAHMGLGKYSEAIENLLLGNKIYNSDIGLLNSLAICYYKIGEKKKALEVLRASLRLDPSQSEVKKMIDKIESGG